MQLHIYKDSPELIEELAKWMTSYINQTLQKNERFTIALSGGETPKALYRLLATDAYRNKIDWNKMYIFWGDERVVPITDDSNNAKMAFEALLNKVKVPLENIHIMRTDIYPDLAANEYEKLLYKYFEKQETTFDLVLLGMGKDGHTLSLFPASSILQDEQHWVNAVYLEDQKMYRITLMPSVVNKAAAVVFLVTGSEKAKVLKEVLNDVVQTEHHPAQLIQPLNGELHWFVDKAAAADLESEIPDKIP
ncbi:MAG: 6-phosphogluconolactonase [Ginsengibacter sp.]